MLRHIHVLIVEDSVDDTFFIVRELQRAGFEVEFERVENAPAMQAALAARHWDLIISDYRMPQFGGDAALALYQRSGQDTPFIMVSGAMGEEIAVEMVKSGAHDYITKQKLFLLGPAVERELHAADERRIRHQTEPTAAFVASMVESCDDAIIGQKLDGTVVTWNSGAERLYGYTAPEMLGRSISVLYPPYRPDELSELMQRVGRGEHLQHLETIRLRKDGSPVEVSVTYSPVKDPGGRIIGASVVARDITQRKQEETERLNLIQDLTSALARSTSMTPR
jgi:two-component system, cell cycle sensor histidine kinase and response regulator CckA